MDPRKYVRYAARRLLRGPDGKLMGGEFQLPDWDLYAMDIRRPFEALESAGREERIVDRALSALVASGVLPAAGYDKERFAAFRKAVQEHFEIPWTAITPRMQRMIYAVNAVHRPAVMIAAGVFCGNTFISNAGAAVGPGAVYTARALVGVEIEPVEAARAQRNVRRIDPTGVARVVAADAVELCAAWTDDIDLLYLDAEAEGPEGKDIYLRIAQAAWSRMPRGALLLAHNSVNSARAIRGYLDFVRDRAHCRASVNMVLDSEGLEVSVK